jgi:hypothetical protein
MRFKGENMALNFETLKGAKREQGLALILAITLLGVLSIIGVIVVDVATRELTESAQIMPNQQALYAADRAVEYALNRDLIINMGSTPVNLVSDQVEDSNGTPLGVTNGSVLNAAGPGTIVSGTVRDLGPRELPPAMASLHGSEFGANLYHVNVTTRAGVANVTQKTAHVDSSIVRLFKLDDDQIFRTSGGG